LSFLIDTVAKRKLEKPKSVDVDRLTEEEMLDLALQNSLAASGGTRPKEIDPDDLTKSFGDISKGKGKETDGSDEPANGHAITASASPFSQILSNNPYTPPPPGPSTTRMQFKFPAGRPLVQSFDLNDPVRRIYEWLKADPIEGKEGVEFELKSMGKDLIEYLDETIAAAGLKNSTIMVEFIEG
jgi:UBX domain-containing protein 7